MIAHARALVILSQSAGGLFGGVWSEPGATVVSEAAAGGTPVIASDNGLLPEIVPGVGVVIAERLDPSRAKAERVLSALPPADVVRAVALERSLARRDPLTSGLVQDDGDGVRGVERAGRTGHRDADHLVAQFPPGRTQYSGFVSR